MGYDIGPKIGIDGEAQFRKQIQDINNGLKTLGSEAKLVASAFDGETNSMEALEASSSVLERQVLTLNEKLDLQKKMLAESAAMYGEADAKTQAWQRAVNATQAEINKLQGQIERNNSALAQASDATGKLTAQISQQEQQLQELQRAYSNAVLEEGKSSDSAKVLQGQIRTLTGELDKNKQKLQEASGAMGEGATQGLNLSSVLSGALSVAAGNLATGGLQMLGQAVMAYADFCRDAVNASTDYADSINTLAAKSDLSTETLQALTYAAELMDVPVTTVTGSMVKLTRSIDKFRDGNAEATQAFEALGLSMDTIIGSDGKLRGAEDVFWVVIDQLKQVGNTAEADVIANTLFGKSFQDLKPLIDQGTAGYKALADEAQRAGYILGTEDLQALQAADDSFQRWDRTMESVKNRIGVELAPVITTLADKAIDLAQNLDWEAVGNRTAQVLDALGSAIITVANNIETIGSAIQAITDPVNWLLDKLGVPNASKASSSSLFKSTSYSSGISTSASRYTQWIPEGYDPEAAARIAGIEAAKAAASAQTVKVQVGVAPGAGKYIYTDVQTEGNRRGTNLTGGD